MFEELIGAGATILGGLFGRKKSSAPTVQSNEHTPWKAAQPYLEGNLATNKQLQDWYQQNPFNDTQKQAYQGLLSDADYMRASVAPGLLGFANNMMTGSYQRPQYTRPGQAGYGGTPLRDQTAGGNLANPRQGPFGVAPQPAFGQINWNAQNPFYRDPAQQSAPVSTLPTDAETFARLMQEYSRKELERQMAATSGNYNAGGA